MSKMSKEDQAKGLESIAQEQEKKEVEGGKRGLLTTIRSAAALDPKEWNDDRLTAMIRFLNVKGATLPDYAAFFTLATRYQLDPYAGQIFLMVTDQGPKVGIERDGLNAVAERHEDYLGYKSGCIYANDHFQLTETGLPGYEGVELEHRYGIDRGDLEAAYCIVYRAGWPPQVIMRRLEEYAYLANNPKKKNWRNHPADMLESRCIAAAQRRVWQLSGLYLRSEIADMDTDRPEAAANAGTQANIQDLAAKVADIPEGEAVELRKCDTADCDVEVEAQDELNGVEWPNGAWSYHCPEHIAAAAEEAKVLKEDAESAG